MFVSVSNYIGNIFKPLKVHSDGIARSKNNREKRGLADTRHTVVEAVCVCVRVFTIRLCIKEHDMNS